jgi:predicted Rossmann-fold nucleotide-binding protein
MSQSPPRAPAGYVEWCPRETVIHEVAALDRRIAAGGTLRRCVLQALDLTRATQPWLDAEMDGAVFLGCRFASPHDEQLARERGALVFPRLEPLPYDPYRSRLYTWQELMEGWAHGDDRSRDLRIYRHYEAAGRHLPDLREALAQRIHDHSIDVALRSFLRYGDDGLPERRAVGIMGGHGTPRDDPWYRRVAQLARLLTRAGYLVVTGGGPGVMEAGNLGAYLAGLAAEELDAEIETLAVAPSFTDRDWVGAARALLERHPRGRTSLAIPTWFYGHEPSNLFATAIAKYFSNSLREDGLLALAVYGVVFAPGSAGTTQEIFIDAVQNHYGTFGVRSPMVFLGRHRYEVEAPIAPLVRTLARGRYEEWIAVCDEPAEALAFIEAHPPAP